MLISKWCTPEAKLLLAEQGQLHVDMVKFSLPVNVQEVRVIPCSVKVHSSKILDRVG